MVILSYSLGCVAELIIVMNFKGPCFILGGSAFHVSAKNLFINASKAENLILIKLYDLTAKRTAEALPKPPNFKMWPVKFMTMIYFRHKSVTDKNVST